MHDFSYQSKNDPTYCVINQPQTYSTSVNFQFPGYHVRLEYVMDQSHKFSMHEIIKNCKYNLCCNRLPTHCWVYHNVTQEHNFPYNLRTRPLSLPFTRHVYAESCLKF